MKTFVQRIIFIVKSETQTYVYFPELKPEINMNVFSLLYSVQLPFFIKKEQMMMQTFQSLDLVFFWRSTKESGKCSTQISINITAYIVKITHLSFESEEDVRKGQITQFASQTKLEGDEGWLNPFRGQLRVG